MLDNYTPQEIKLAREIAATLDDMDSFSLHLQYVRKYKEAFLRKILGQVMAVPENKIRKTRAALYVHLIGQSIRYGDGH